MRKDQRHYLMPTEDFAPEAVILANGDFPTHPLPLSILKQAKKVICCDGAASEYSKRGFTPEVIVGDGDSLDEADRIRFADIIYYSSDTETNDLTKAVNYCISQRISSVCILGATGKREDHTIGNIGLLIDYMDKFDDVLLITDYGVFVPIRTDATFESYRDQAVSVFTFKSSPIRGRGLQYPLSTFTYWWQGTLNKASGTLFTILARDKTLVYRAF